MLRLLASQERTVTELAAPFQMSLAAASKHIKVLEDAGLLHRTIQGRTHTCRLNAGTLAAAHRWLGVYARLWSDQLDALERKLSMPEVEVNQEELSDESSNQTGTE
jgi:DNA-binding transcriptional ArsR family regulator